MDHADAVPAAPYVAFCELDRQQWRDIVEISLRHWDFLGVALADIRPRGKPISRKEASSMWIIRRPVGGRRFKYACVYSEVQWRDHPDMASAFNVKDDADQCLKDHKSHFGPEDEVVPYRPWNARDCALCGTDGSLRRTGVGIDEGYAVAEFVCTYCNINIQATYEFYGTKVMPRAV
jgi:hypothetical protein